MSNGAAGAAAAAAAIAKAIKASGVVVRVSPEDFQSILSRAEGALVVHAQGGIFRTKYKYLLGYKGFAFFTESTEPMYLPARIETVRAGRIWIPG
jgi:hypothetical protein